MPNKDDRTNEPAQPLPDAGPETPNIPRSNPAREGFVPADLVRTVIAIPLLNELLGDAPDVRASKLHDVVIDLRNEYPGGRDQATLRVSILIARVMASNRAPGQLINEDVTSRSQQYVIATLTGPAIQELVQLDQADSIAEGEGPTARRAIYRIWPDFEVRPLTTASIRTVKADAAQVTFSAFGSDIVWAVIDSGIDGNHPHFRRWKNLELEAPIAHHDFTGGDAPLTDPFGHGTHVAGIIGGQMEKQPDPSTIRAVTMSRDENGIITYQETHPETISGMAPRCKLVSLRALNASGSGKVSNLIAAIEEIQRVNGNGRNIRIHGVNLSVGYGFDPKWFACGHSPLCVEINRLVRSGVVVVTAAGNTGFGWWSSAFNDVVAAGADLTINDPGNAELAITVGSTHRDRPHVYGVSYFSSKGPTGDGRTKPDLVAPGERIISCGAGKKLTEALSNVGGERGADAIYIEDSGTSMAAPHVSGAIAAFLSVQQQFIGEPEKVKEVFTESATDLGRERNFQGHGLLDLMRAIQSV